MFLRQGPLLLAHPEQLRVYEGYAGKVLLPLSAIICTVIFH